MVKSQSPGSWWRKWRRWLSSQTRPATAPFSSSCSQFPQRSKTIPSQYNLPKLFNKLLQKKHRFLRFWFLKTPFYLCFVIGVKTNWNWKLKTEYEIKTLWIKGVELVRTEISDDRHSVSFSSSSFGTDLVRSGLWLSGASNFSIWLKICQTLWSLCSAVMIGIRSKLEIHLSVFQLKYK